MQLHSDTSLLENSGCSGCVDIEDDFNELEKLINVEPCFCDGALNYNVRWCVLMQFYVSFFMDCLRMNFLIIFI